MFATPTALLSPTGFSHASFGSPLSGAPGFSHEGFLQDPVGHMEDQRLKWGTAQNPTCYVDQGGPGVTLAPQPNPKGYPIQSPRLKDPAEDIFTGSILATAFSALGIGMTHGAWVFAKLISQYSNPGPLTVGQLGKAFFQSLDHFAAPMIFSIYTYIISYGLEIGLPLLVLYLVDRLKSQKPGVFEGNTDHGYRVEAFTANCLAISAIVGTSVLLHEWFPQSNLTEVAGSFPPYSATLVGIALGYFLGLAFTFKIDKTDKG